MVMACYNEDACYCHNGKREPIAATENEKCYGKQNGKAHRGNRHKTHCEQKGYKNSKTDQSCAPIDEPYACKKGHNRLAALEIIPHGECVAEHTAKQCGRRAELCGTVQMPHYKARRKHWENGFANVDRHHAKGRRGEAVESFEIGKAGVFASKLTDILTID